MRFSFHAEQWLPYPVPVVFAILADPKNLPPLMPAWQKARIDKASIVPALGDPSKSSAHPPATIQAAEKVASEIGRDFRPGIIDSESTRALAPGTSLPPVSARTETFSAATAAAGAGTRLTLSFRPFPFSPIRASWEAEITEFAWNDHFCDRQLRGPFAYWNHCHRVEAASRNGIAGTAIVDHIDYEPPFGVIGILANLLFLRRQLARTFAYRQQQLAALLAAIKQ